jgi:hypothetical protein
MACLPGVSAKPGNHEQNRLTRCFKIDAATTTELHPFSDSAKMARTATSDQTNEEDAVASHRAMEEVKPNRLNPQRPGAPFSIGAFCDQRH